MARHNVYRTLIHLSKLMQVQEDSREESQVAGLAVWEKLSKKGTASEQMKMIKLLQKHFPVLQAIFDVEKKKGNITIASSPQKIKNLFTQQLIPILNRLRNEYSHYAPELRKKETEKELFPYLYRILDGAAREIRSRFPLTNDSKNASPKDKPKVNGPKQNKEEGDRISAINKAVEYIFQGGFRKEQVYKLDKNGAVVKDKKGKKISEFKDKSDYFYALGTSDRTLSDIGIIFFTCLFLEKRYIAMFLEAMKPWPKDFDEIKQKAVLEVFSVYHIRLPREKYDSTRPDYALGLDMINELQKCPKELFDILSVEHCNALSVDIKAEGKDVVRDDGVTVKDGKVQMRRVRDRFAPLALRYLDMQKAFEDIRFMVHLGNYRFKFYKKQCLADNAPYTLRVLQKEINGFGRIDEIELERKKQYSSLFKATVKRRNDKDVEIEELLPDTPDSSPYVTNTKAHYLIDNNRVGLRMDQSLYVPLLKEGGVPVTASAQIKLYSPQAWLSVYELPGLLFYLHLCKAYPDAAKKQDSAETVIKNYIQAYQKLFEDIRTGDFQGWDERRYAPLEENDLPVKIKMFIQSPDRCVNPLFAQKAQNCIREMIAWTEREIKGFKTKVAKMSAKDNKLNKKRYVDIRPGAIALKLARDILRFTPPSDAKSRMTSANFNSLQSALALSNISVGRVKEMVKDLNHPFIGNVFQNYKSQDFRIFDFYRAYLEGRLQYLKSKNSLNKASLKELPFLHSGRVRWQTRNKEYIMALAGRYLEGDFSHGFELPRGLFTRRAESLMRAAGVPLAESTDVRGWSMSNLINAYFAEKLGDDNQIFYQWARHYDLFDKLSGEMNGNRLVHKFLEPEQLKQKMSGRKNLLPSEYMLKKAVNSLNQTLEGKDRLNIHSKASLNDTRVIELAEKMLKKDYQVYDDNERLLRRLAVQDKMMYLMAKDVLLNIDGIDKDSLQEFKLRDICLREEKSSILELRVPFRIELQIDDITLTIKQKELIKIKRYGEFFRYNSDTRLRSLLRYLAKTEKEGKISVEVDRDMLETELSGYDRQRITVMKLVQAMEQSILSRVKWPKETAVSPAVRQNFNTLITDVGKIPYDEQGKILISIRNSFCHN
ncbi:MAG: type VI-B CRISPR-associated RNA-guided ribonuclease Cas13b [Coprobacter sp.]|nr:type VI-B CRISPR-associated RNA-guided ribonuclease Cas13b [Coprobacter sp.]